MNTGRLAARNLKKRLYCSFHSEPDTERDFFYRLVKTEGGEVWLNKTWEHEARIETIEEGRTHDFCAIARRLIAEGFYPLKMDINGATLFEGDSVEDFWEMIGGTKGAPAVCGPSDDEPREGGA